MKQKLPSEEQQSVYNVGYTDGTQDQFVPMVLIGICGCVIGVVLGLCL